MTLSVDFPGCYDLIVIFTLVVDKFVSLVAVIVCRSIFAEIDGTGDEGNALLFAFF